MVFKHADPCIRHCNPAHRFRGVALGKPVTRCLCVQLCCGGELANLLLLRRPLSDVLSNKCAMQVVCERLSCAWFFPPDGINGPI